MPDGTECRHSVALSWSAHGHFLIRQAIRLPQNGERSLKALDTIGNCQRPVFSLGVFQHMHKITYL